MSLHPPPDCPYSDHIRQIPVVTLRFGSAADAVPPTGAARAIRHLAGQGGDVVERHAVHRHQRAGRVETQSVIK